MSEIQTDNMVISVKRRGIKPPKNLVLDTHIQIDDDSSGSYTFTHTLLEGTTSSHSPDETPILYSAGIGQENFETALTLTDILYRKPYSSKHRTILEAWLLKLQNSNYRTLFIRVQIRHEDQWTDFSEQKPRVYATNKYRGKIPSAMVLKFDEEDTFELHQQN